MGVSSEHCVVFFDLTQLPHYLPHLYKIGILEQMDWFRLLNESCAISVSKALLFLCHWRMKLKLFNVVFHASSNLPQSPSPACSSLHGTWSRMSWTHWALSSLYLYSGSSLFLDSPSSLVTYLLENPSSFLRCQADALVLHLCSFRVLGLAPTSGENMYTYVPSKTKYATAIDNCLVSVTPCKHLMIYSCHKCVTGSV